MSDKKRLKKIMSPFGIAVFPHLVRPDFKFDKDGKYKVKLRLPSNNQEAQDFAAKLQEHLDEFVDGMDKKQRKECKEIIAAAKPELNDEGDETGNIVISFSLNARITDKAGKVFELRPNIYDADSNLIEGERLEKLRLYGGSIIRINAEVNPYYSAKDKQAGLNLRIRDVQVKKLCSSGGSPFGAVEGGGFKDDDDDADNAPPSDTGSDSGGSDEGRDF